ncbi:MAG: TIGR02281 family clan AA aspartic protease [Rubrivivax sp.]
MNPLRRTLAAALALAFATPLAGAQTVSLGGVMGTKAALLVDGQPVTLAVGDSARGVKLLQLEGDTAVVETTALPPRRFSLRVGAQPASVGAPATANSEQTRTLVLAMGPGGHFHALGQVNGRSLRFMVDTGASSVALSRAQAEQLGLDWRRGDPVQVGTANGSTVAHRVVLSSLRVGGVEVANVEAVVLPANLPQALLGNSFLGRFQMRRDNDVMRLELRP